MDGTVAAAGVAGDGEDDVSLTIVGCGGAMGVA